MVPFASFHTTQAKESQQQGSVRPVHVLDAVRTAAVLLAAAARDCAQAAAEPLVSAEPQLSDTGVSTFPSLLACPAKLGSHDMNLQNPAGRCL